MGKTSIVLELQHDALDEEINVSLLLRKSLFVASKLELKEFQEWIDKELQGYRMGDKVPEYRFVKGQVKAWDPYNNGWIPVISNDPSTVELMRSLPCSQSIAELDNLLRIRNSDSSLRMPLSHKVQSFIHNEIGYSTEIMLFTDYSCIIHIFDTVRDIIFRWSINLEKEGIFGEGPTLTDGEREEAMHIPQSVNYFFGPVVTPQIQQGTNVSIHVSIKDSFDINAVKEFVKRLNSKLPDLNLDPHNSDEAEAEINTLIAQISSSNPKNSIIKESLNSLRIILENAEGTIAAEKLLQILHCLV